MITFTQQTKLTISPDPNLWVSKFKTIYKRLTFEQRRYVLVHELSKYMKTTQLSEYYIKLHYELSTKNKNFHAHGIIFHNGVINKVELVQVVGANLQHQRCNNPEVCVKIEEEWEFREDAQFQSWEEYMLKDKDTSPVQPDRIYINKDIPQSVVKFIQEVYIKLDHNDDYSRLRLHQNMTLIKNQHRNKISYKF